MSANTIPNYTYQADWLIADPGAGGDINNVSKGKGVVEIVTAAAEARAVKDPLKAGIELFLCMKTDGGDCTLTFETAFNVKGDTVIVLADVGEFAGFFSVPDGSGGYVWRQKVIDLTQVAVTAIPSDTVDGTYGAQEQDVINGLRVTLNELLALMRAAGTLVG